MMARYWHDLGDGRVQCDLCPRHCRLRAGQRGFCFVRRNEGGVMRLTTYGRSSGFALDPVEKKPLNHVVPGSTVLSFGTVGCNLACKFCQNWDISTARRDDVSQLEAGPAEIAQAALRLGARGVAYTYNDPVIFSEYAIDTAAAVRELGLLNIAVTAGYICPPARAELFGAMDAANVDLKSFNPDFYRRVVGGRLEVVLETLEQVAAETSCWLEITTLLIPGLNDSEKEISQLCEWVVDHLGPATPLHFTGFHPANRLQNIPRTTRLALSRARQIGLETGLSYVYTGNVSDELGATTFCPGCGYAVIQRQRYEVTHYALGSQGCCPQCGANLPGLWDDPLAD